MASEQSSITLEVRRDDWAQTRLVEAPLPEALTEGEVLLRVDCLALTANNISYASAGDSLGYWGFFPAAEGWGRIPAMGWADVIASAHPALAVGERLWGFYPFATHLKIAAGNVGATQVQDVSPHRAQYAPVYARFDRAAASPIHDPAREDQDSLLRGLFMTSWLVRDFLESRGGFGAETCVITSASSKTGIALAHCLRAAGVMEVIGLTSPGNTGFCESLGYYDRVLAYAGLEQLDAAVPVIMVDMAGSARVISAAHRHFGDNMRYSCRIGATHYREMGPLDELPGAAPEFFFAPEHIRRRSEQLGAAQLMQQLVADYLIFRADSDRWLCIGRSFGAEAAQAAYQAVLAGHSDPATGQIVSLWPALQ